MNTFLKIAKRVRFDLWTQAKAIRKFWVSIYLIENGRLTEEELTPKPDK